MISGILNINKPEGISSFDAVRKIKKITKEKKVGHAGTLDPLATGVLPICIGKATKVIDYIMNESKIYRTTLKLGITTDTYDREGSITSESILPPFVEDEIIKVVKSFSGRLSQVPPMYSALKINGQRLYDLARQGIEIERQPREVYIYDISIMDVNLPYIELLVHCSKGTYIRSLCYDIGAKLGCGAVMWKLQREKNGIFHIDSSINLDDLTEDNFNEYMLTTEEVLAKYPSVVLDEYFTKLFINGVAIHNKKLIDTIIESTDVFRVYDNNNAFIGIGRKKNNTFKLEKLLF